MVTPRRAQEDHSHAYSTEHPWLIPPGAGTGATALLDDGTWAAVSSPLTVRDDEFLVGMPNVGSSGATLAGELRSTPSGSAVTPPEPTGGGSVYDARIKVARQNTAGSAGFVSGPPSDGRFLHTTRGFAFRLQAAWTGLSAGNRMFLGAQAGTGVPTADPPASNFLGIWVPAAGGNVMIGTSGGDSTDSGFTLVEDLEYVVTGYCAAGGSAVDLAFECENGDSGTHTATVTGGISGSRYMLVHGVATGTGSTGGEAHFIYWATVCPD